MIIYNLIKDKLNNTNKEKYNIIVTRPKIVWF